MKGKKMAKGTSIGEAPRKSLADISNLPHRPKPTIIVEKEQSVPLSTIQYIEQLRKENMTFLKLLADRNQIIELSRIELNKLQLNLQKVQLQNLHLAQANSQMLGELNSGKDMLKTLCHELGCKNSLAKVTNIDLKEKAKTAKCQITGNETGTTVCNEAGVSSLADEKTNTEPHTNRRRQSKNNSWAPSSAKSEQAREKAENKRPCLRRRSARFKHEEPEPSEDRYEMEDANIPVPPLCDDPIDERDTSTLGISVKKEYKENNNPSSAKSKHAMEKAENKRQSARFKHQEPEPSEDRFELNDAKFPVSPLHNGLIDESDTSTVGISAKKQDEENKNPSVGTQEFRRSSMVRPVRRAVEKIQSYKEIPLNVKMRRSD